MARDLVTPAGQGDDGHPDEALVRALAGGGPRGAVDPVDLAAALRGARVFVAIESRLVTADVMTGADKTSEMALATLRTPSGATALPVFTSVSSLAAWRSSARPVPVPAVDACAEAVRLGLGTVVIDVAGPFSASLDVGSLGPADADSPQDAAVPAVPAGARSAAGTAQARAPAPDALAGTVLRPLADPDGPLSRRRVQDALRTVSDRVEVWPAELVDLGGAARPVLAVAVGRSGTSGPDGQAGQAGERIGQSIVRQLSAPSVAVLVVDAEQAAALRRHLGPGLRPARRWPRWDPRRSRRAVYRSR